MIGDALLFLFLFENFGNPVMIRVHPFCRKDLNETAEFFIKKIKAEFVEMMERKLKGICMKEKVLLNQEGLKEPKTKKGQKMQKEILQAARIAFSKKGYFGTRISDITSIAGISEGNFYRYFNNSDEVFRIIIKEVTDELYKASESKDIEGTFYEKMEQSTKRLFRVMIENADLYKVLLQVVHYDEEFSKLWNELRKPFYNRVRKGLEKIDMSDDVDKDYAATALLSMVSHFTDTWIILGGDRPEKEFDIDVAAKTVARIWYNSLKNDEGTADCR